MAGRKREMCNMGAKDMERKRYADGYEQPSEFEIVSIAAESAGPLL